MLEMMNISKPLYEKIKKAKEQEITILKFFQNVDLNEIEMDYDDRPLGLNEDYIPFYDYVAKAWVFYPNIKVENEELFIAVLPNGFKLYRDYNNDYSYEVLNKDKQVVIETKEWYQKNNFEWLVDNKYLQNRADVLKNEDYDFSDVDFVSDDKL